MASYRSRRAELKHLRDELRGQGRTWAEIAERIRHDWNVNARQAFRHAHGMSQQNVADQWNTLYPAEAGHGPLTSKQISYWETWPQSGREPSITTLTRLARIYRCDTRDLLDPSHHEPPHPPPAAATASIDHRGGTPPSAAHPTTAASALEHAIARREEASSGTSEPALLESPVEIAGRVQWVSTTNVDDMTLDLFDSMVTDIIEQYERAGPARLALYVVGHRRQVHEIMRAQQHPRQRDRLFVTAARLSCILAAVALDLGQWAQARAYSVEAFHLAQMVDRGEDLRAWVRATQSLIEYYAGRYDNALALARDGQDTAPGGPHSIRLAVNGEARALARLGDHRGVEEAVDRAFTQLADSPTAGPASPSLSLGPYCQARAAGNAATAYLSLADSDRAVEYASRALATFDTAGLRGPQALTRLDMATALVSSPGTADPERAAALAEQALRVSGAGQFQSVGQRAAEFLAAAQPWHDLPAVQAVQEAVRSGWAAAQP